MKPRLLIAAAVSFGITLLALVLTLAWDKPSTREIQLWQQVMGARSAANLDLYQTNRPAWQQRDDERGRLEAMARTARDHRMSAAHGTDWIFGWGWKLTALFLITGILWPPDARRQTPAPNLTPAGPAASPSSATPNLPGSAR